MADRWLPPVTTARFADLQRRFRILRLSPRDVLRLLYGSKRGDYLELYTLAGLPDDVEIISVTTEWEPICFALMVYHPSFELVRDGEIPPIMAPGYVEMVRLKRLPDDPPGTECYLVPSGKE